MGAKVHSCSEGDILKEENLSLVNCSDSRYAPYKMNESVVDNDCKPYPVAFDEEIVTMSDGAVFEITMDYSEFNILAKEKLDFPKVVKATQGFGGICGYTSDNKVYCQRKGDYGVFLYNEEKEELNRNIEIVKLEHDGNTLCALYADKEVSCILPPRYTGIGGGSSVNNGSHGRGRRTLVTVNNYIWEYPNPIAEYKGATDLLVMARGINESSVSCVKKESGEVKCSGYIDNLSTNGSENVLVPVTVENKHSGTAFINAGFCPFPEIGQNECFRFPQNEPDFFGDLLITKVFEYGRDISEVGTVALFLNNANNFYYKGQHSMIKISDFKPDFVNQGATLFVYNKQLYFNVFNPTTFALY